MGNKVLIITYYWPPSGGVGVQRWMNYALKLQERGIEPIILTPQNPQFSIQDKSQLKKVALLKTYTERIWEPFDLFHKLTGNKNKKHVQQGLVLEKTAKTLFDQLIIWIRGNIFLPDPRVFWVRAATKKAKEIIAKEKIDRVVTTGPPHSMHLVGKRLKRDLGIYWLADFRDPWSRWDILKKLNTSFPAMEYHKRQENAVLKNADKVISVSDRMAASLNPSVLVLTNGVSFDKQVDPIGLNKDEFVMGYFGMLNELRNPQQLLLLLDQICRENKSFGRKFKLKLAGIISESIRSEVEELEYLRENVEYLGYLSHEEVQKEYQKCHILLLLLNKSDNSKWILPLKFFEYLAANRMILALGSRDSDLGNIMKGRDIGELLEYNDLNHIRSFILDSFDRLKLPDQKDTDTLLKAFSHDTLVLKLIAYLNLAHAKN